MLTSPIHIALVAAEEWAGGVMYTHNLVKALSMLPSDQRPHITLLYERDAKRFEALKNIVNASIAYQPMFVQRRNRLESLLANHGWRLSQWGLGERSFRLAMAVRRAGAVITFPVFGAAHRLVPGPIAWIPDFQHRGMPQLFSAAEIRGRDRRFAAILKHPEQQVIFSSQHAQNDAKRYFGDVAAQQHLLRFATVPEPNWADDPAPIVAKYQLPARYLIVCNQFWAHKGHATLFEALHQLAQAGQPIHLVCTGPTQDYRNPTYFPSLQTKLREWGIESLVHMVGMIPRYDQIMLMRGASAIMQPSVFEGWSTVLEDARALGQRVIATDFPVHLEQDLLGALYFRAGDVADCVRAIRQHFDTEPAWQRQRAAFSPDAHHQRLLAFARAFMSIAVESQEPRIKNTELRIQN